MHSGKIIRLLFVFLMFQTMQNAWAEDNMSDQFFRITYLTSDDGLSQNTVDCILKDSRGFMWFGTWNGLNRYDGYSFKVYKREDQHQSISNNFIHSMCEDKNGNLWIGTRNGLNLFEFENDRFINFYHDSLNSASLSGNWINAVYCDQEGTIWVGTNGQGVDKVSYNTENDEYSFENYFSVSDSSLSLSGNTINTIYSDSKKRLWIGTEGGLMLYDKRLDVTQIFTSIPTDIHSLTSSIIQCIFEDHYGTIWIGTQFGLNRWLEGTQQFARYVNSIDDLLSLSHFRINDIGEDPEGKLYFATLGGLDYYNRALDGFLHLPVHGQENISLNNEFINSLLCDSSGLVWIGTEKGGINKFNIYQKQFKFYSAEPAEKIRLNHNTVNSILDEKDVLWIGTAGGGLNQINRKSGTIKYYTFNPHQSNSLSNDFVTSLCRDRNNNLWVGTWGGGFVELQSTQGNGRFHYYQYNPENENSLINNFVSAIYEDFEGKIWIGTEGGLDLFNPKHNTFIHIQNKPVSGNLVSEVGCLLRDSNGNLWIGTRNGLFYISSDNVDSIDEKPNNTKILHFRNEADNQASLSENYVTSLFEDISGNIWIGTYGNGLNKLDKINIGSDIVKFVHYTQEEGLSNNVVYGILEDKQQNLWLSTDYGLSRFNPEKEEFSNYYVADGLQSNQFYWGACESGANGMLYFGGMKGVNYFLPEKIINNQISPTPIFTDFKVYNNTVGPGDQIGKRIILPKIISQMDNIKLSYRENTFSLEFSGLSFNLPEKNMYEYKLEGVDNEWVRVNSNRRFANYTKLPGGEYIFRLKAANNDGLWNETPLELKITIKPPFWKTGWFRIILISIILLLIVGYLRLHTRSLQQQKRKLELLVKERTTQIEDQNVKLELQNHEILEQRDRLIELNRKVNAANQLKLKFFTNISHEFRTPLTLILGPLKKLRKNWKAEDETKQSLNLINRNAERLLHLINQLMEFRKIEKGKMTLHVQQSNIEEYIKNILEAFKDLVLQKKIDLVYTSEDCSEPVWFDHEKLENVLYNLLSNAFKYTPEKGRITVRVKLLKVEKSGKAKINGGFQSFMQIDIEDTGVGISEEKLPYIFKRFYQAEQNTDISSGTGIGLSLTRELVKVHKGQITVDSQPGEGTVFNLQLPCGMEAFSEEEISQTKFSASNLKSHVDMLKHLLEAERGNEGKEIELKKRYGKPTLLIVEDNFELREFVASHLNQSYNILLAENGDIAFQLAVEHNPEIIISDIMMPITNGLQLCSMIKQNIDTSHIPVILLTAKGTDENKIEGYRTGADDYIPKPFNLELLETRITNLIDSRVKLRKLFSTTNPINTEEIAANPVDQKFLKEAIQHIEKNLDNAEFNVNDFASVMCVSRSLLHKKLTALTEQSATDFINTVRLKKSKELMINGSYNISEVAYSVGYNDPKYFSRMFRKHFGVSPSEYVKELDTKAG